MGSDIRFFVSCVFLFIPTEQHTHCLYGNFEPLNCRYHELSFLPRPNSLERSCH